MGQKLLPLFPTDTEYLTSTLGVFKTDNSVFYLHSGVPIYSHLEEDLQNFRFITSKFLCQRLCTASDIVRVFHVSTDSVGRYRRQLEQKGEGSFFGPDHRHGHNYKMTEKVQQEAQKLLSEGQSQNSIAKQLGLSEGSIRYWIGKGVLKKKSHQ